MIEIYNTLQLDYLTIITCLINFCSEQVKTSYRITDIIYVSPLTRSAGEGPLTNQYQSPRRHGVKHYTVGSILIHFQCNYDFQSFHQFEAKHIIWSHLRHGGLYKVHMKTHERQICMLCSFHETSFDICIPSSYCIVFYYLTNSIKKYNVQMIHMHK